MTDQAPGIASRMKEGNPPESISKLAESGQKDGLQRLAQDLASTLTVNQSSPEKVFRASGSPLLDEIKDCKALLHKAYRYFQAAAGERLSLSYAAEWMLDNYYVVQQSIREIQENLPTGFYNELPTVNQSGGTRLPRIYAVAREFLLSENFQLDIERLETFVEAFQQHSDFTMGELWALSSTLRVVLVQALVQAVAQLTGLHEQLEGIYQERSDFQLAMPEGLVNDDIVAECIIGLRTMINHEWKDFFEATSLVERALGNDPTGIYFLMETGTRDRYRKQIGDLARGSGRGELEVAQLAVDQALEAYAHLEINHQNEQIAGSESDQIEQGETVQADAWRDLSLPRYCHVGYYLVDEGRSKLEQLTGFVPSPTERIRRWIFSHPTLVYLGSLSLLTMSLSSLLVLYARGAGGSPFQAGLIGILSLLLTSTVSVNFINWLLTNSLGPRLLPKLDFDKGIPESCQTLVVIPAILSDQAEVESLIGQIELHYLRNTDENLSFALLTDFADAKQEQIDGDNEILDVAIQGVRKLNLKYGREGKEPFLLLQRPRKWNSQEGKWMGWERKRGKLHDLNQQILGAGASRFTDHVGEIGSLSKIRYVITLDADTILPGQSARRLVAALAHPLNRAEFDPKTNRVRAGYTILQPRIEISPPSANRSTFARTFSGDVGLDLYTLAVSDIFQDLFGAGIYIGKGIYDVESFERSLDAVVPENALLSHDLFEGIHGRVGLISTVSLIEEYPHSYLVHMSRMHRWIRGDWQLLPWLLPRVPATPSESDPTHRSQQNPLSMIDRWKILDNLRRSLVSPALLLFLLAGWVWLPGSALVWTIAGIISLAGSVFTSLLKVIISRSNKPNSISPISLRSRPIRDDLYRWFMALVFLPHEAYVAVEAITVTLLRLLVTRRNLLQWTTASQAAAQLRLSRGAYWIWVRMGISLVLTAFIGVGVIVLKPSVFPLALPFLVAWSLSPRIAYLISIPQRKEARPLDDGQNRRLRTQARLTWLYFEQFVNPDDHWLPPDHYQESPRGIVAHRTSPTNIGLALLSTLAAYDFGYTGILELAARLKASVENIARLEKYRGHLLNWYDTRSLEPLNPRYVSTVDSGNLAGSLIALGQGCLKMGDQPVLREAAYEGFLDTLAMIVELLDQLDPAEARQAATPVRDLLSQIRRELLSRQTNAEEWVTYLLYMSAPSMSEKPVEDSVINLALLDQHILKFVEEAAHLIGAENLSRLRIYSGRVRYHLESFRRKIETLLPWIIFFTDPPALFEGEGLDPGVQEKWEELKHALTLDVSLSEISQAECAANTVLEQLEAMLVKAGGRGEVTEEAQNWCARLKEQLVSARLAAKALCIEFLDLHKQCEQMVREMDFCFLFDTERQIFHIGYNLELGKLDANYYDLLASEARIASLVAIAHGQVPQSHWLHLSRPFTQVDGTRALLSWSATMFEYLMPDILLRTYEGTLLHESSRAAIDHQIRYGQLKHVPWGISESSYYHFDDNLVYQYRAFGVPGLGFKRGLSEDLVITPYASLLALPQKPGEVAENLEKLIKIGMLGIYGLYEAVDYTPSRVSAGEDYQVVRSYMTHHQGMIFLSLANYFKGNIMVDRFHSDPNIQSVELLLQEQVPKFTPLEQPRAEDARVIPPEQASVDLSPWSVSPEPPQPRVHYLSNGRYRLMLTSSGAGFSSWQGEALTRFHTDATLNPWGSWIYVLENREDGDNLIWSPTFQPCGAGEGSHEVLFFPHQVDFRRRNQDISLAMEVTVPPEDDLEIRRLSLTNHAAQARHICLLSYGEVVLRPLADDQRHPAFGKLFIETEFIPKHQLLLYRRRPRSSQEKPSYLGHFCVPARDVDMGSLSHETDRAKFIGRGGNFRAPHALRIAGEQGFSLSNTTDATLDPVFSLCYEFNLPPHSTVQVAFILSASDSRQSILETSRRYRDWHLIERAFDQSRASAELELRRLGIDASTLEKYQKLLSVLLYPHAALRAEATRLATNQAGQPTLWAYGISGDYPILLVKVEDREDSSLVRELLMAHVYWRRQGLLIDLVLVNMQGSDYGQELSGHLRRLISSTQSESWMNRRGGIFIVNLDRLREVDRTLLETVARVVVETPQGSLAEHLEKMNAIPIRLPAFVPIREHTDELEVTPALARPDDLLFDNGYGGFSVDGREYVIFLEAGQFTPAPWVNVIANPGFGFLVSETGGGYTWALNSGENRLSPWSNDPLSDPPGEVLYFRDEETAAVWTPTPLPAPATGSHLIRHQAGVTTFEHNSHGLKQQVGLFPAVDQPVKIIQVCLENTTGKVRRITATYYVDWVLGLNRETTQQFIIPEYVSEPQALLATNPYNTEFASRVAFLASSHPVHGLTADRAEFLGRLGSYEKPAGLGRIGLSGRVEAGMDPCAALQIHIDLQPGQVEKFHFLLGQGDDRAHALELIQRFSDQDEVEETHAEVIAGWDRVLGAVQVRTPDLGMDLLLNRWLLYQSLSCRIWGRSAFYQSSGAYGFRDQLQDVLSVLYAAPDVARRHILRAARHQFEAGDVLHWWHPPSGRGVRTRYSDDLLWLPYAVAVYVNITGDEAILDEQIPYLQGQSLERDEEERYGLFESSRMSNSLYDHCLRAIEKGSTSGRHHLPLIGAGDWNDGMNRVGVDGRGESVWLGWFLSSVLDQFADLCNRRGDSEFAERYRRQAASYRSAIDEHAWDGNWYLRAFYDDGTPLGSTSNRECQIDAIAQSWAVLSGSGQPDRASLAMQSVSENLVLADEHLLLLFKPPFDKTPRDPGYIKGYLPGIRENGGQYTHASLWTIWAYARLGEGDLAGRLFGLINPIYHADSAEKTAHYQVEPYVIAADVYSRPPHTGRGGWTWYTGSAGWMYRLGLEGLLGLNKAGDSLFFNPCIPIDWKGYSLEYRYFSSLYRIVVENPAGVNQGIKLLTLDERVIENGRIHLVDDGETHRVQIVLGNPAV